MLSLTFPSIILFLYLMCCGKYLTSKSVILKTNKLVILETGCLSILCMLKLEENDGGIRDSPPRHLFPLYKVMEYTHSRPSFVSTKASLHSTFCIV